ncbi:MAG: drug/metabolite transporter (DMT)-like permease [Saprospiraceae bacterium]|jgi:drug/metabolite transporter (DMT)-like permease
MRGVRYGGFLALIGAVLFSTKAILVKLAYNYDIDSVSLLNLRMLFALPIFAGIAIHKFSKDKTKIALAKEYKWSVILFGFLGYYVASLADLEGLRFIDASLERIVIFMYPTLVVILSYIFLRKRITRVQLYAIVTTYIGVMIALGGNLIINASDNFIWGVMLILFSAFAYAIYLIGSGEVAPKLGTRIYNSLSMTVAALAIIIHNAILHGFNMLDFQWEIYLIAFLISTFSTVIPSYMIVEGIRIIGASKASIIGTVGPISTIILASLILQEDIHVIQWVGSLLVVASVVFVMLKK